MIVLPRLTRAEIDAWPIPQAGLRRRAVNSLTRAGIATVEQLRACSEQRLLRLAGFGVKSLENARQLFRLGERLEAGAVRYAHLEDFLGQLLSPSVREVVEHRYGLRHAWTDPRGPRATLQALGTKRHLTRERVRQLQVLGDRALASKLSQLVFGLAADRLTAKLNGEDGVVSLASLQGWRGHLLGGYSGAGVLWLLRHYTDRFRYRHGFFTTATEVQIDAAEATALVALRSAPRPLTAERVVDGAAPAERALTQVLLHQHPFIAATVGGEFFLPPQHGLLLAEQILWEVKGPLHYRKIAEGYNARVRPPHHCAPRRMLKWLAASARCERLNEGFWRLTVR